MRRPWSCDAPPWRSRAAAHDCGQKASEFARSRCILSCEGKCSGRGPGTYPYYRKKSGTHMRDRNRFGCHAYVLVLVLVSMLCAFTFAADRVRIIVETDAGGDP